VNKTVSGTGPEVGMPLKLAFGGFAAATGRIVIASKTKRERDAHKTLRCTCFATIKQQLPVRSDASLKAISFIK